MTYLKEFEKQIKNRDFHKFFQLWEEYATNDQVDSKEFIQLLELIEQSEFSKLFGQFTETALPLWELVENEEDSYEIIRRLIDIETTNSENLAEVAYSILEKLHGSDPKFKDRIRQVGLRTRQDFQGAITNYELLAHLKQGNFVYHKSGWGTGEVMDVSDVREQASFEFENVVGIKHLNFDHARKTLIPIKTDHFLARRFANPDLLEEQARKDPVEILKCLLRDLGPKTAAEIKDELAELVIPEKDWVRWWQNARSKLKKDTMVETPSSLRDPFILRKKEVTHEEELQKAIDAHTTPNELIQTSYTYARDLPQVFRKNEIKDPIKQKLIDLLNDESLSPEQELSIYLFLENIFGHEIEGKTAKVFIQNIDPIEETINRMEIIAFKKRALVLIKEHRQDWAQIFLSLLSSIDQSQLRDYILDELQSSPETRELLIQKLEELLLHPEKDPELSVWYFQKVTKKKKLPFTDKEGQSRFLESFLILLHKIEHQSEYRDLSKKMVNLLTEKRFAVIRKLIEGTTLEFINEFLLLVSKCHSFTDHDQKILRSLAQVVHPSLAPKKKDEEEYILWTTEEGFRTTQERVKNIATVEMVENAKEVEAARALGDLRENAEYKFACERRSRLQNEMKHLTKQLNHARIITPQDIHSNEVGVGSVVNLEDSEGNFVTYTILGPWETDPEKHIISFQSQMARAMLGHKMGDSFTFRDQQYKIKEIKSYLE